MWVEALRPSAIIVGRGLSFIAIQAADVCGSLQLGGWIGAVVITPFALISTDLGALIGSAFTYVADWLQARAGFVALIAGVLAYVAGRVQARATRLAADRQIAAAEKKDRLQVFGIALAITPELLNPEVDHDRASRIVRDEFPMIMKTPDPIARFGELAPDLQIPIPPLLNRNIDHLYLLGDAAYDLLQLVSIVLQYDGMADTLARHISEGVVIIKPPDHAVALSKHLSVIGTLLRVAKQKVAVIHDEAVPPEQSTPVSEG